MKILSFVCAVSLMICSGFANLAQAESEPLAVGEGTSSLRYLPVQDGGRLKPYDTFAREALQLIYGKQVYTAERVVGGKTVTEKMPAVDIVTTWLLAPSLWEGKELIQIQHSGLKESLGLPKERTRFASQEITKNGRLALVFQELAARRETKEKLDPYYQAVQRLETQLSTYIMIQNAELPRVAPDKQGDTWLAVRELDGELREKFMAMTKAFISNLPQKDASGVPAAGTVSSANLAVAVNDFIAAARAQNPSIYADGARIRTEVHYKSLHPFMWTWILYCAAAIVLGIAWYNGSSKLYGAGWFITIAALALHTYGFALRVYLTGRPPVSNMYETVVWVSWGSILFAMIFEYASRSRAVLTAGAVVGTICLIVADMAPAVLDKSMQPLEPVLRSTLWLTIHVLVITISYSAFFLAWGLGMFGMGFVLRGDGERSERLKSLAMAAYRSIQVGVVLLAAGIILGGIWADYSWGRFWGWDPKETWALIALLGYIALLHGRLTNWVGHFGMLAGSIVSFALVIMAWYGVNFVLGAGLHSYGFGAGGVEYVSGFLLLNFMYVGYAAYVRRARQASGTSVDNASISSLDATKKAEPV